MTLKIFITAKVKLYLYVIIKYFFKNYISPTKIALRYNKYIFNIIIFHFKL